MARCIAKSPGLTIRKVNACHAETSKNYAQIIVDKTQTTAKYVRSINAWQLKGTVTPDWNGQKRYIDIAVKIL
jgi:hypothetical protein